MKQKLSFHSKSKNVGYIRPFKKNENDIFQPQKFWKNYTYRWVAYVYKFCYIIILII